MENLIIHESSTAQWQALIYEAENACSAKLGEELQSYLVFLLMRYIGAAELANSVLALEYLNGMELHGKLRAEQLRKVGDKCLLYSGLFPGRADRRRVRISYYVKLGASAYAALANSLAGMKAKIFTELSQHFVALMDVLQATRELGNCGPALEPLQAIELWSDTGSHHALATLSRYTQSIPVHGSISENKPQFKAIIHSAQSNHSH